jgi:hypothetical protein
LRILKTPCNWKVRGTLLTLIHYGLLGKSFAATNSEEVEAENPKYCFEEYKQLGTLVRKKVSLSVFTLALSCVLNTKSVVAFELDQLETKSFKLNSETKALENRS